MSPKKKTKKKSTKKGIVPPLADLLPSRPTRFIQQKKKLQAKKELNQMDKEEQRKTEKYSAKNTGRTRRVKVPIYYEESDDDEEEDNKSEEIIEDTIFIKDKIPRKKKKTESLSLSENKDEQDEDMYYYPDEFTTDAMESEQQSTVKASAYKMKDEIHLPHWFPFLHELNDYSTDSDNLFELPFDEDSSDASIMVLTPMVSTMIDSKSFDSKYLVPLLQFLYCCIDRDSSENLNFLYVSDLRVVTFTPMYFLRQILPTVFIRYLACRSVPKFATPFQVFRTIAFKTNHQFHIGFVDGLYVQTIEKPKEFTSVNDKLLGLVTNFFRVQFETLRDNEVESIKDAYQRGYTYFIYGTDGKGGFGFHIIACIMFSSDLNGIYVNWLAIHRQQFNKVWFGKSAPEIKIRRTGLGLFLLKLLQLQASSLGFSQDIFLQVNMNEDAAIFYERLGFKKTSTNSIKELPLSWQAQDTSGLYIKFVDDATNEKEAEERAKIEFIPPSNDVFLHLYKLKGKLIDTPASYESDKLVPVQISTIFLHFPYLEFGLRLNEATKDLLIFGNPYFKFFDSSTFLTKDTSIFGFKNVEILTYMFKDLDQDLEHYQAYMSSMHIGLAMQWFVKTNNFSFASGFEIVRDDILASVGAFYDCMMNNNQNMGRYEHAFVIHKFLMESHGMIQSRFIFFLENVNQNHWTMSCLCNPWVFMQKGIKEKEGKIIMEKFEHVDQNFIHGWLHFDPLKQGFFKGNDMDDENKKFRESLVWLLNMAVLYSDCKFKKNLKDLDFCMYRFLKYKRKSKWLRKFEFTSTESWKAYEESQPYIKNFEGPVPPSFHFVVQWFIFGLDGPFGRVTGAHTEKTLYNNSLDDSSIEQKIPTHLECLHPHPDTLEIMQSDKVNCGVCCCLFVYDMIVTQIIQSWKHDLTDEGFLPSEFKLGSSMATGDIYNSATSKLTESKKKHLLYIYNLFREELVVLIKRLRLMQIETSLDPEEMKKHPDWGELSSKCKKYHDILNKHMKFNSEIPSFEGMVSGMDDNKLRREMFVENYVILKDVDVFTFGNLKVINQTLNHSFQTEEEFEDHINHLYESSFVADAEVEKNLPVIQIISDEDVDKVSKQEENESKEDAVNEEEELSLLPENIKIDPSSSFGKEEEKEEKDQGEQGANVAALVLASFSHQRQINQSIDEENASNSIESKDRSSSSQADVDISDKDNPLTNDEQENTNIERNDDQDSVNNQANATDTDNDSNPSLDHSLNVSQESVAVPVGSVDEEDEVMVQVVINSSEEGTDLEVIEESQQPVTAIYTAKSQKNLKQDFFSPKKNPYTNKAKSSKPDQKLKEKSPTNVRASSRKHVLATHSQTPKKSPRIKKTPVKSDPEDLPNSFEFAKYLDDSGVKFKDDVPSGKGAIDLRGFSMEKTSHPPTFSDVLSLGNKDFDKSFQDNMQQAATYFKKAVYCQTPREYKSQLAAANSTWEKQVIIRKNAAKMNIAKKEACLAQVKRIKYLAWNPDTSVKGEAFKHKDGTLKGKYIAKVLNKDDELEEQEIENDWAERNFSVVALAYIQRVAYDNRQNVVVGTSGETSDKFPGFVDCEKENVTFTIDNDPIHLLKYVPKQILPTKDKTQKSKFIPGQWQGHSRITGKDHWISENEAKKLAPPKFLEQVKRQSLSKKSVYVEIPPGANNVHKEFPSQFQKGPLIKYVQKENERTCLVTSISSLLYFANSCEHASQLFGKRKRLDLTNVWHNLNVLLMEMSYLLKLKSVKIDNKQISSIHADIPIITSLQSSDGTEDHTVTIYQNWIFDGNFTHALPLKQETLDLCCSSDTVKCTFKAMVRSYSMPFFKEYLESHGIPKKMKKCIKKQNKRAGLKRRSKS